MKKLVTLLTFVFLFTLSSCDDDHDCVTPGQRMADEIRKCLKASTYEFDYEPECTVYRGMVQVYLDRKFEVKDQFLVFSRPLEADKIYINLNEVSYFDVKYTNEGKAYFTFYLQ